ncbi:hypothetical protein Goshw_019611 [Gossypium schwendimanii]|uniref:Uncharacterized protein n=1 Tax=Gossypium schwendimanii TaxID=34291 RepID=A0A7J9MJ64_GOSSC|nr:hypothetical protein [Gossypium schwendimanii]
MTGCLLSGDRLLLEKSSKCCLREREPGPSTMEGIVSRRVLPPSVESRLRFTQGGVSTVTCRGIWYHLLVGGRMLMYGQGTPPPRTELTELKKTLNVEVEQLRSEFQELRNTLHHQQEDVTASLRNLGLQDVSEGAKEAEDPKVKLEGKDEETLTSPIKENGNEVNI